MTVSSSFIEIPLLQVNGDGVSRSRCNANPSSGGGDYGEGKQDTMASASGSAPNMYHTTEGKLFRSLSATAAQSANSKSRFTSSYTRISTMSYSGSSNVAMFLSNRNGVLIKLS